MSGVSRRSFLVSIGGAVALSAFPLVEASPSPVESSKPSFLERVGSRRIILMIRDHVEMSYDYFLIGKLPTERDIRAHRECVKAFMDDLISRDVIYDYRLTSDETNNPPSVVLDNDVVTEIFVRFNRSVGLTALGFAIKPHNVPRYYI